MADEPFVALMRRYCIDYTNRHDLTVCDQIMSAEYSLHMGDHHLEGRDGPYKEASTKQFVQFPHLGLVVHDIVTNGDRLAMRFSEHGSSVRHDGAHASWGGIGIYRWDGSVLTENWVEQDYFSRRTQLSTRVPVSLEPPAIDPWVTAAEPASDDTEAVVRRWLHEGAFDAQLHHRDDGLDTNKPLVEVSTVRVNDLFTAGRRAAFHARVEGVYGGGLSGFDDAIGTQVRYFLAGIADVDDGAVVARMIGLSRQLKG